jgi:hypothetical protein
MHAAAARGAAGNPILRPRASPVAAFQLTGYFYRIAYLGTVAQQLQLRNIKHVPRSCQMGGCACVMSRPGYALAPQGWRNNAVRVGLGAPLEFVRERVNELRLRRRCGSVGAQCVKAGLGIDATCHLQYAVIGVK